MIPLSTKRTFATAGIATLAAWTVWSQWRRITSSRFSFENKVVVITGGSRGLGLEMARIWLREGAKVAICARTESSLAEAAHEFEGRASDVYTATCDVTQQEQAERFIHDVIDRWGTVDVLVNNAGIIQTGPLPNMTFDDFERTMATHFWAPLYLIHAVLPSMQSQGSGKIVNIASIGGEVSVPHLVPYSASKYALVGLSEGLAAELRATGIDVTTVCPGLMRTGSPRNAEFKGNHRAEYAWFSISGSLPVISINSQVAARRIVEACRRGSPYLRITLPARIGVPLRGLFPGLTSHLLGLVNRLLPKPLHGDMSTKRGYESFSAWSPSPLTALTEKAAHRNNEIDTTGPGEVGGLAAGESP